MQEKFIIYLSSHDPHRPYWAVVDENNHVRQSAISDGFEGLSPIAENKTVIVLVPAIDVLIAHTVLPKMRRSQLLKAIPYALEDQLIDEVDNLHFALQESPKDQIAVAIVTHEKMQTWLALLSTWNIKPDYVFPAMFALPIQESNWSASINEIAIVRTKPFHGFACDINNFDELVTIAIETAEEKPPLIILKKYNNVQIPQITFVQEKKLAKEEFIKDMAYEICKNLQDKTVINLLAGPYHRKKPLLPINYMSKMISYLACATLITLLTYPLISYFILDTKLNEQEANIASLYHQYFPNAKQIVAPKERMQAKLREFNSDSKKNHLLILLGKVGIAFKQSESIKINKLNFSNDKLSLDINAPSDALSQFTKKLLEQGLNVKQENANVAGSRINATLEVT